MGLQKDGKLTFVEKDGIDYAPTTVQLPGGERVPFLFTVKNLVASTEGNANSIDAGLKFSGKFMVPSYRTGLFLDPKGRGTTTGYDQAVALPALQAGGDDELFKENNKKFDVGQGSIELKVTEVNAELGEIGGVFVQKQTSDPSSPRSSSSRDPSSPPSSKHSSRLIRVEQATIEQATTTFKTTYDG